MAYVFVATGHKAAGLNTTPNFFIGSHTPTPFKGEDVTDYEIGLKSTLFDGHVRTQIGGYYTLYNNFQESTISTPPSTPSLIENVTGQIMLYGVEAQVQAQFGPWTIDANASLSHSRLGHFICTRPLHHSGRRPRSAMRRSADQCRGQRAGLRARRDVQRRRPVQVRAAGRRHA